MQSKVSRGEIYYIKFGSVIGSEQGGLRPAVVLQNDSGNKHGTTTIVAPLTAQKKPELPTHVWLPCMGGLSYESMLLLEQLRTVDQLRIGRYIGTVDAGTLALVDQALAISLGIGDARRLPGRHPRNIRTLCPLCARSYSDSGYKLNRLSSESDSKDTCTLCNVRKGFDFEVEGT